MRSIIAMILLSLLYQGCRDSKKSEHIAPPSKCRMDCDPSITTHIISRVQNGPNSVSIQFDKSVEYIFDIAWHFEKHTLLVRDSDILWDETRTYATMQIPRGIKLEGGKNLWFNFLKMSSILSAEGHFTFSPAFVDVDIIPAAPVSTYFNESNSTLTVTFLESFRLTSDTRVVLNGIDYTADSKVGTDEKTLVISNFTPLIDRAQYNIFEAYNLADEFGNLPPGGRAFIDFLVPDSVN